MGIQISTTLVLASANVISIPSVTYICHCFLPFQIYVADSLYENSTDMEIGPGSSSEECSVTQPHKAGRTVKFYPTLG